MRNRSLLLCLAGAFLILAGSQQAHVLASPGYVQHAALAAAAGVSQPYVQLTAAETTPAAAAGTSNGTNSLLPGVPDPASEEVTDWIRKNGGEVNVAVRVVPGMGRTTYAPRDFQPGDVFARVPVEMTYKLEDNGKPLALAATELVADMSEPDSPWVPYFKSLPTQSEVRSMASMPLSYMPIIQDNGTEYAILGARENLDNLWDQYGEKYKELMGPQLSAANITHAMSLFLTRIFQFDDAKLLIPLLDMSNHRAHCTHSHVPEPCDPEEGLRQWKQGLQRPPLSEAAGSGIFGKAALAGAAASGINSNSSSSLMSAQCIVWRAEEPVAAGQEICNSYKTLFQDRALLQYGYLQAGPAAQEMSAIDRHDFDPEHVWGDPEGSATKYGPMRFEGSPTQINAEIDRLSARLGNLKASDAAIAAIRPDPARDPEGSFLAMMLQWRQERQQAIVAEITRLQQQAERIAASAKSEGDAQIGADLSQWLQRKGAKVHIERRYLETSFASNSSNMSCSNSSNSYSIINSITSMFAKPQPACSEGDSRSSDIEGATGPPPIGVFTQKAMAAGDIMAVIPVTAGYVIKPGIAWLDSAVSLMLDIHQARTANISACHSSSNTVSPDDSAASFKPFLASLPPFGTVQSPYNFPREYLPLLQNPLVEHHIKRLQGALMAEYQRRRGEIEATDKSISFAELQHVMSLVSTSPLLPVTIMDSEQLLMFPLFSAARHNSSCPHGYYIEDCPENTTTTSSSSNNSSSSLPVGQAGAGKELPTNQCLFWVAGSDLDSGAEVCNSYGYLRPDQALLMYGIDQVQGTGAEMLQQPEQRQGEGQPMMEGVSDIEGGVGMSEEGLVLNGMDTADASDDYPFGEVAFEELQATVSATRDQALAECARLANIHLNLTRPDAAAAFEKLQPAPRDASEAFLSKLMLWRRQRIAAIEEEVGRLALVWNITSSELKVATAAAANAAANGKAGPGLKTSPAAAGTESLADGKSEAVSTAIEGSDPYARLLNWLRSLGAMVNVDVADAGPPMGRIVVTKEAMTRGDLLAAIPLDICWTIERNGGNGSMELAAANLFAEMDDSASFWRAYLDALPSQADALCPMVSMPPEYRHLMQSDIVEDAIEAYQSQIDNFWEGNAAALTTKVPSITFEAYLYARGLLSTRLFGLREHGVAMVPLVDLANHAVDCPNLHHEGPCPQEPSRVCMIWQAGAFISPGAEVCNGYNYMRNDRSMLQYGFLQSGPRAHELHALDDPWFNRTSTWAVHDRVLHGPPNFNGTSEELQAEASRLRDILSKVAAGDAAAAATAAAASDKTGRLLSMILTWREQRKAALATEIARLEDELAGRAAAAEGRELAKKQSPEAKMLQWLQGRGAQVSLVRIGVQDGVQAKQNATLMSGSRGVFALESMKAGSLIAAVPLDVSIPVMTDNLLYDAPTLWVEKQHPRSPEAPYFAALPPPSEVISFYNIPLEYAPVIQHKPTVNFLERVASHVDELKEEQGTVFSGNNMTPDDMMYMLSLVATRIIHFEQGAYLVPLMDMANHWNNCPHIVTVKPCNSETHPINVPTSTNVATHSSNTTSSPVNTTRLCVMWRAGADISAGEEVCINYGYLLPDKSMLQYGFVARELLMEVSPGHSTAENAGGQTLPLFGCDRHDFADQAEGELPWKYRNGAIDAPPTFSGTNEETSAEISRLQKLAAELSAGDSAAAAVKPVDRDTDGAMLGSLQHWRALRKMAVSQEIQRLQQQQSQQVVQ